MTMNGQTRQASALARAPRLSACGVALAAVLAGALGAAPVWAVFLGPLARVPVGAGALAMAVNPATNQVYVANRDDGTVTVIDGATNGTTTIAVGSRPVAVAVNAATNKVYVADQSSNDVAVIDGASRAVSRVAVGGQPVAVAVNSATNRIYVANQADDTVTVIDGVTGATATVGVGGGPVALGVNETTGKVYVGSAGANLVTVIDGATNGTTAVATAGPVIALAVDPLANEVWLAEPSGPFCVQVLEGATNRIQFGRTSLVGSGFAVGVNPLGRRAYAMVANEPRHGLEGLLVEDSQANGMALLYPDGTQPGDVFGVAVDTTTGKAYGLASRTLTVVEGVWPPTTTAVVYNGAFLAVAVNVAAGTVYISEVGPSPFGNNVAVLSDGADLAIAGSAGPDPATIGGEVSYTFTVTNHGPLPASHVLVSVALPAGTAAIACTTTAGTCDGTAVAPSVAIDALASGAAATITLRAGIGCTVADRTSLTATASVTAAQPDPVPGNNTAAATVTAVDLPPVISGLAANPAVLWPPDRKLRPVTVDYAVADSCPLPPGACGLSVASDEPAGGGSAPAWVVEDAHHVSLRAERSGAGDGRVYTISVTCTDGAGGTARQGVQVVVPKSQGGG